MPLRHRSTLLSAALAVVLAAGLYLSYELGRYRAGYSLFDVRREVEQYQQRLAVQDEALQTAERQLALLETTTDIDRETYAQVEADLGELQARIQAQQEELEFYRSIVSPEDGVAGLRIPSLEVVPVDAEGQYLLKLVLVQAIVHTQDVTGVVTLGLAGTRDGVPAEYDLADLAADRDTPGLAYGFRYFQGLEVRFRLPAGFTPERIDVEIRPAESRAEPITQSFPWSVAGG